MPLLYAWMRDWWFQRAMLSAQGVEEVDRLDELLAEAAEAFTPKRPATPAERREQIIAFMAAAGGG